MISEQQYKTSALTLCVDVPAIKAVAEVESGGSGFLSDGKPVILFEPHVFWKQLRAQGIDPNTVQKGNEDILYPIWGSKPYGGSSKQHERLDRATKINRTAALQSASWGKFQIMGYHWKTCGCSSLQDFINKMYQSEDMHLHLFTNYIKNSFLDDELRVHDWKGFARSYNGALYWKNNYDSKLKAAYQKYV